MLLEGFQLLLPLVSRLLIMLHSISPTYNGSSHSIIDGTFGAHASAILGNILGILALSNSYLLAKYSVMLCAMVPVMCPPWGLM